VKRLRTVRIAAACAGAMALLPVASASATSFPVTNTGDSGAGSLRQAITDANGNSGLDQIPISATGTIQLATELPEISEPTQISGPGAASLAVRRNFITSSPVFTVAAGATSVEFSGLTIINGNSTKIGGGIETALDTATTLTGVVLRGNHALNGGGGIGGEGSLVLNGTTVSGNTTDGEGGGISGGPSTILTNSVVSGNTAAGSGAGGILAPSGKTLTLTDSTVAGNHATGAAGAGGGILTAKLSILTLTRATVSDNDAVGTGGGLMLIGSATITDSHFDGDNDAGTDGGGINVTSFGTADLVKSNISDNDSVGNGGGISSQGVLRLTGTTVDGNESDAVGGGIVELAGELTVSNSTIAGNLADSSGGGIAKGNGTATINSTTITGNAADFDGTGGGEDGGGGIATEDPPAPTPVVSNTLIAANTVGQSEPTTQCSGAYVSGGFNLRSFADAECTGFTDPTDIVNSTPLLGALGANGGPTLTIPLLAGSPAINTGNPAALGATPPACPTIDQRGLPRGGGAGTCDIGAFEVQPQPAAGGPAPTAPAPATTAKRKQCKKKKKRASSAKKCKKRK
jgi:hypothetical protein